MKVKVTEIERRVIALLDENSEVLRERTVYGDESAEIGYLVRMLLPDAARVVLEGVPVRQIDEVSRMEMPRVAFDADGRGVVSLPSDFLRLVRWRMSDWGRGVSEALDEAGEAYMLRCGGGLRSRRLHGPAVAVVHRGGGRALEIFGSSPGATVTAAYYVAVPQIEGPNIELPAACVDEVVRKTAEMVEDVIGEK